MNGQRILGIYAVIIPVYIKFIVLKCDTISDYLSNKLIPGLHLFLGVRELPRSHNLRGICYLIRSIQLYHNTSQRITLLDNFWIHLKVTGICYLNLHPSVTADFL